MAPYPTPPFNHCGDAVGVRAALAAGWASNQPQLPYLVSWLKDINWRGARSIAEYLATLNKDIIPHIRLVLDGDDSIWKYNCLSYVVKHLAVPERKELMPDLQRLAASTSRTDKVEGVVDMATEILLDLGTQ